MTYGDPALIARIKALNAKHQVSRPAPPPQTPSPPAACTECGGEPAVLYDHYFAGWCRFCITAAREARKRSSAQRAREKRSGADRLSALDRRIASDYVDHVLKQRPCEYCGDAPFEHLEHRTPLARGGSGHWHNITSSCAACNLRKATKTEDEFKAILRRERNWSA